MLSYWWPLPTNLFVGMWTQQLSDNRVSHTILKGDGNEPTAYSLFKIWGSQSGFSVILKPDILMMTMTWYLTNGRHLIEAELEYITWTGWDLTQHSSTRGDIITTETSPNWYLNIISSLGSYITLSNIMGQSLH